MMKSETLRCSFGSRKSSGLKAASPPSRGTLAAILQGRSSVSKLAMRLTALRPASSCRHVCSAPTPNGDNRPMPVTTTRLIPTSSDAGAGRPRAVAFSRSGSRLVDVLDGVTDGQDRLRRVVRDLNAELFLKSHDELDRVEAVRAQIVDEARLLVHLVGVNAEMLDNDLLHAFRSIAHF